MALVALSVWALSAPHDVKITKRNATDTANQKITVADPGSNEVLVWNNSTKTLEFGYLVDTFNVTAINGTAQDKTLISLVDTSTTTNFLRLESTDGNIELRAWGGTDTDLELDTQGAGSIRAMARLKLEEEGVSMDGSADALTDDTYTAFKQITDRNAGETINQWDLVYLNVADGEWHQADADESEAAGKAWGIAAAAGTDGNPLTVIVSGIIRNDGWAWSAGAVDLYVSDAAGELTETAPSTTGDVIKLVARTLSDDEIYLDVTNHFLVSQ